MLLRLPLFFILLTLTSSVFAATARHAVVEKYEVWMRCHGNPSAPNCPACEDDDSEIPPETRDFLALRCLPSQRETAFVFSNLLSREQKVLRDDRICACYLDGRAGGLEAYSFSSGSLTTAQSNTPPVLNKGLLDTLFNQRVLTVLSATTYTRTDSDTAALGGRYSFSSPTSVSATGAVSAALIQNFSGGAINANSLASFPAFQEMARQADERSLSAAILNSTQLDPNRFCIPYRNFLASQEFPREDVFYEDIRGMRDFNSADWNYTTLMDTYRTLKGSQDEDTFLQTAQGRQIFERLRFLHNNPVIRDVFLAPETPVNAVTEKNKEAKDLVFNQIKTMPLPCRQADCSQNSEWIRQMQDYRQKMMGVLRDDRVIAATEAGTADYRRMVIDLSNLRASQPGTSDSVIGPSASYDTSQWRGFCANRDRSSALAVFDQLSSSFGERNAVNPESDTAYVNLNQRVCTENRMSSVPNRPGMNLQKYIRNFRAANCSGARVTNPLCSPENRTQLVAQFIKEYPADADTGDTDTLLATVPYLEGELRISSVGDGAVTDLNSIASSPERRHQPFEYSEPGIPNYSSSLSRQVTRSPASTTTPNPQTNLPPERIQGANGNTAQADPFFVPTTPQAEVAAATPEAVEAELEEGEEESERIRDEISSLRDVMRRDPQDGGPRDSQAMTDLNQRLASLERRLRERERENTELREQIEEADTQRTPVAQRSQAQTSGGSERRAVSGPAQAVAQGGASAGSSISAPGVSGGAAQPSSVSGRTASVTTRPVISSGNAALLSKYGVQSGSVQGALIIANPSAAVDYQALRSQSEGSVLSLPLPLEEYNLIASNNQEALRPYLDQCRALAGSVCRLNISSPGTSNQLELFVVKNGNEVSIIPTNSPDRRPAAVPASARVFTLNELQNELQGR